MPLDSITARFLGCLLETHKTVCKVFPLDIVSFHNPAEESENTKRVTKGNHRHDVSNWHGKGMGLPPLVSFCIHILPSVCWLSWETRLRPKRTPSGMSRVWVNLASQARWQPYWWQDPQHWTGFPGSRQPAVADHFGSIKSHLRFFRHSGQVCDILNFLLGGTQSTQLLSPSIKIKTTFSLYFNWFYCLYKTCPNQKNWLFFQFHLQIRSFKKSVVLFLGCICGVNHLNLNSGC